MWSSASSRAPLTRRQLLADKIGRQGRFELGGEPLEILRIGLLKLHLDDAWRLTVDEHQRALVMTPPNGLRYANRPIATVC